MSSEWKEIRFGEIIEILTDYHSNGAYKKLKENVTLKDEDDYALMIRTTNFEQNDFIKKNKYIDEHAYNFLEKSKVFPGDIIMNKIANAGSVYFMNDLKRPVSLAMNLFLIRVNDKVADPRFVYFYLKANEEYVKSFAQGSVTVTITKDAVRNLILRLPPLVEQKKIVKILGDLSDKIELNRQTNKTLEEMAQALFQSWFVDFDPVIDNALKAGNSIPEALQQKAEKRKALLGNNPHTLPEAIQSLFSSAFVWNEVLGKWVPEGWEDLNLSKCINVKHGFAFKGEFFSSEPTNDILVTPGNFKIGGGIKFDKLKYYNGVIPEDYILKEDDLIITMTDLSKEGDTLGYPAIIPQSDKLTFLHNQRVGKVEYLRNDIGLYYLYHCLCKNDYRHFIVGSASGTTVKHTSPSKILLHNILFTGGELETIFEQNVEQLFKKIEANNIQTETLTKTRDTLLPKLISGRIKLN